VRRESRLLPIAATGTLIWTTCRGVLKKTRAIVVNTPNNPSGRVLTRAELEAIAELCRKHDAVAVTDEIYEHIYY